MNASPKLVLHVFSTFQVGGPQRRFVEFANYYGPRYRHVIVAMDGRSTAFAGIRGDIDARLLCVPNRGRRVFHNVAAYRRVIRSVQPDLLVTSNWGTIEWAAANFRCRTRHLHMEDGFGPDEATAQLTRRVLARRLVLRQSKVVVPSVVLATIARDTWRLPTGRIIRIPNGVDCARFGRAADVDLLARFGICTDRPVVGAVTPLRPEKNLTRLIDAFAELRRRRRAQLVIVGEGPERNRLQARVVHHGIGDDVVFTGHCAAPEGLLPAFSVVTVSSDTEQMPLAVLEAMAAGRALAATDVGDIRNMVAEENRPFIVGKSAGELAQALAALLASDDYARTIGAANARRARQNFDQQQMFAAYRNLFDGCAALS